VVIPELIEKAPRERVYLGVGPEQNFPYIIALAPKIAFIFDIRRGNLHEQLLYKALFEMSTSRADFLSKLWSRARPPGLTAQTSIEDLMAAYDEVEPTAEAYAKNLQAVSSWLTGTHRFRLRPDDLDGIDYVYKTAFYEGGPGLRYSLNNGAPGRGRML